MSTMPANVISFGRDAPLKISEARCPRWFNAGRIFHSYGALSCTRIGVGSATWRLNLRSMQRTFDFVVIRGQAQALYFGRGGTGSRAVSRFRQQNAQGSAIIPGDPRL